MGDTGKLYRLLDANLNRAREGLRVIEDAFRFLDDNSDAQQKLKSIRHSLAEYERIIDPGGSLLLSNRASDSDVGAFINSESEMSRESEDSVVRASMKRVQEALRCLEEYGKLVEPRASEIAKKIRFDMYNFEKDFHLSQDG